MFVKASTTNLSRELSFEVSICRELCALVNSPRSLMVDILLANNEWEQISELFCNPRDYIDSESYADDSLVMHMLKKSPNLPLNRDLEKEARDLFFVNEGVCREANANVGEMRKSPAIERARRICSDILGPLNEQRLTAVHGKMRFSSGKDSSLLDRNSFSRSDKYRGNITLSRSLTLFARSIMGDRWTQSTSMEIVDHNVFFTVPKDARKRRGCCFEPSLNIYLQLGIGAAIRNSLARFGFSIKYQSKNQSLAARAYKDGLATIDFSNASDNISWGLVRTLLPERWFQLLDIARVQKTRVDDQVIPLEKFSSMGNGFTFELESLLFLSLTLAVVPHEEWDSVSVYGDDVILPQAYADDAVNLYALAGMKINPSKSYLAGNFFESCGKDYFCGVPVRGFYLKGSSKGIPYPLQVANALRAYAKLRGHTCCDMRFRPIWISLLRLIPKVWKAARVPPVAGDVGLISDVSEVKSPRRAKNGWEGIIYQSLSRRPFKRHYYDDAFLYSILDTNGISETPSLGFQPLRGKFGKGLKVSQVIVPSWPDDWAWLQL